MLATKRAYIEIFIWDYLSNDIVWYDTELL